jgi:hypothetical protein
MQLNVNEQLAMLTALQKAVKAKLDEIRAEADATMLESYEDDGVVKKALKVGGVKVGDYIVVLTADDWAVTDAEALEDFALTYGFATSKLAIKPECMDAAVKLIEATDPFMLCETVSLNKDWKNYITNTAGTPTFLDSGEMVPGIEQMPPRVKCTQVRGCKPEDVVPQMQKLGGIDRLLLGDGEKS